MANDPVPPFSVWHFLEQEVEPSELCEIKNIVGDSLIDEIIDLHREITSLSEIYEELRERRESSNNKDRSSLAGPPEIKEILLSEIRVLLETIREKSKRGDTDASLEIVSGGRSDVIEYVKQVSSLAHGSRASNRPVSACERHASSTWNEFAKMAPCLNHERIEQVVEKLRQLFTKEKSDLLEHTNQLHEAMIVEHLSASREPSLGELKDERRRLRAIDDVLASTSKQTPPPQRRPHDLEPLKTVSESNSRQQPVESSSPPVVSHLLSVEPHLPEGPPRPESSAGRLRRKVKYAQALYNTESSPTLPKQTVTSSS